MLASDQQPDESSLSAISKQILSIRDMVFEAWEKEVRKLVHGAEEILHPILINTLPVFYDNIAEALSPNHPREQATSNNDVAAAHGSERARMTSYGPEQVIHEYQIFRETFAQITEQQNISLGRKEWSVVNNSIDSAIRESVREFTARHEGFRHQLAASLSHDMRNPLSVLISAAQILDLAPTPDRKPVLLKRILDNGRRLGAMIEDLLDALSFNRDQKLPLVLSEFDVLSLVKKIAVETSTSERVNCTVVGESLTGFWSCDSLMRAVENLVSNAVKYGDGKDITIKVDQTHGRLLLSVHNTGPVIAKEHQARIFQYLWRERESTAQRGWGIGLPFVQKVADSHGGSTVVDSSPASGTTFLIDIPIDCRPFADTEEV